MCDHFCDVPEEAHRVGTEVSSGLGGREGTVRRGEALGREAFQALTGAGLSQVALLPCTPAVRFSVEARVTRGRMAMLCLAPGDRRSQRSPRCLAELGRWLHVLFLSVLPRGPPRPALTRLTSL